MGKFDEYISAIGRVRQVLDARILGQNRLKESLILCFFSGGLTSEENSHILLRSIPGRGKTTAGEIFASAFDLSTSKVELTIDQMPKDFFFRWELKGKGDFVRHYGKIFVNIFIVDEINRAHPDAHAAFLGAFEKGKISPSEGTFDVPFPFMVIGTYNPIEQKGTHIIPEALKDRFRMQAGARRLTKEEMLSLQKMHETGAFLGADQVQPLSREEALELRAAVQNEVEVGESIHNFVAELVAASSPEENKSLAGKTKYELSPRANIALIRTSKVVAFLDNRPFVIPNDVERVAQSVLAHRIILGDEFELSSTEDEEKERRNVVSQLVEEAIRRCAIKRQ